MSNTPGTIPTPFIREHAAVIFGVLLALVQAIAYVSGLGEFEDGVQLPDVLLVVTTLIGALGLKTQVWSQEAVDELAPKSAQQRLLKRKRSG